VTRPRPTGYGYVDRRELRLLIDRRRLKALVYSNHSRHNRVEAWA